VIFKHIDRLLVFGYFKAYAVCLLSLLSLYVVVDLFTNLDEFTSHQPGLLAVLQKIGTYYAYQTSQIFDRLSEVIVLLAAMFTVAWMQRNNELLPLLSAGVPTRRVVMPVLFAAGVMLTLAVLNQELIISRIGNELLNDKEDPTREVLVQGGFEPNGIHVEGGSANRVDLVVKPLHVMIPEGIARNMIHLTAQEGRYIPPVPDEPRSGGWLLTDTEPAHLDDFDDPRVLEQINPGHYFLPVREATFEVITRKDKWFRYASTLQLYMELQKPESTRLAAMAVLFHGRFTRPILGMILVVLGLSVILRDQNRNVFISAGMCLVLCAIFFVAFFSCKSLGDNNYLSPPLAAWLPVLFFGPLAFAMFDAVHT
jgi:lipopolysaccharide export system permease protein